MAQSGLAGAGAQITLVMHGGDIVLRRVALPFDIIGRLEKWIYCGETGISFPASPVVCNWKMGARYPLPFTKITREGKVFRPVERDTGNTAANAFIRPSAHGTCLAVFNYDQQRLSRIELSCLGVAGAVTDVASGTEIDSALEKVSILLQPPHAKLVELRGSQQTR